jgi:hypothetical protein
VLKKIKELIRIRNQAHNSTHVGIDVLRPLPLDWISAELLSALVVTPYYD